MHVKICGITRPEDALHAESAGADAVGLNFVPNTKRFISLERARDVLSVLGPFMARVGVFQNASLETVLETVQAVGLNVAQLHGQESDAFALEVQRIVPVVRAVKLEPGVPFVLPEVGSAFLIDGPDPGSGQLADWSRLEASNLAGRRWLLAGGLTAENVAGAIARLKPWGVDLSSGVESAPGIKDPAKVTAFIRAAQGERKDERGK
jgi:phosphoribosylanthranilate isomerase